MRLSFANPAGIEAQQRRAPLPPPRLTGSRRTCQAVRTMNSQMVSNIATVIIAVVALGAFLRHEIGDVRAELAYVRSDVAELRTDVAGLKTDVAGLKIDVAGLKADVAVLKTDVAVLKTDVSQLKVDVSQLKTDVAELRVDVADLKERMVRVEVILGVPGATASGTPAEQRGSA